MSKYKDALETAEDLAAQRISAKELVESAIKDAERINPIINAIVHERFEKALTEAADPNLSATQFRGVPILIKDLGAEMEGEPHTQGAQVLKEISYVATRDSYIYKRLRKAGFIAIGRTNCPEFGTTMTTEPLAFGPTLNPWNTQFSSGGSSGGSAAAVAAGVVTVAHGNDGGGSIRIPASLCGLVGLKPTRGRVSLGPQEAEHWGGASVDHVLTVTVRDSAALLDVLAGYETGDPYVAPRHESGFLSSTDQRLPKLKIGLLDRPLMPNVSPDPQCARVVAQAARLLEEMGHTVEINHPRALEDERFPTNFVDFVSAMVAADVALWSAKTQIEIDVTKLEPTNQFYYAVGTEIRAPRYLEILSYFGDFRRDVLAFWDEDGYDLLLTPTLARPPARVGYLSDPIEGTARVLETLQFTAQFNITGQPAISLPMGFSEDGVPMGIQLVANYGREDLLFAIASRIEEANSWINTLQLMQEQLRSH
ncbi:amidase [Ferrithrix thermotolerans DSM 19514]|jgi:amidase|uniref:Amidase n=1 Tax=Ferrithrix thermotolerans DSM 19514 TaxID=1121881 RepID=A0A1M4WKT3_9ACTN|nr:amidase [Ferrithrix thermotolerans]SHE81807.1 amidase [Ferrithrix thermotolerans DSM 19514]